MAVIVNVNFDTIIQKTDREIQSWINEMLWKMKSKAKEFSPTKEWDFKEWHEIIDAEIIWNKITGALVNMSPYSLILEYWVKGRVYKYHKWPPSDDSTVFYTWVWNRTYTRVWEEFKWYLSNKLKW